MKTPRGNHEPRSQRIWVRSLGSVLVLLVAMTLGLLSGPVSNAAAVGRTVLIVAPHPDDAGPLPNDGSPLTLSFAARTVTSVALDVDAVASTTSNIGLGEIEVF